MRIAAPNSVKNAAELDAVFAALKQIVKPYQSRIVVTIDQPDNYTAETPLRIERDKPLMFALLRARTYVAFHFFPVYAFPDLLKNISAKLEKHMQGRTCWTFKSCDDRLFSELAELVAAGFARYESVGILTK
jgi:hypothetical protein